MELKVDNCPSCGSVYQKNFRNLCTTCSQSMDNSLQRCLDYLWRHPSTHTEELSQVTSIPKSLLYTWIKEGKLSTSYKQLTYPCESCTSSIRHGRLCSRCHTTFNEVAETFRASFNYHTNHSYISKRT